MNCDLDLPKGHIMIDTKDSIEIATQGNIQSANAEEKRSKEDFFAILGD